MKRLLFIIFLVAFVSAQSHVVDYADVLSTKSAELLDDYLREFAQNTTVDVFFVTLDAPNASLGETAKTLFSEMNVDRRGAGILLLMNASTGDIHFEMGDDVALLSDVQIFAISRNYQIPLDNETDAAVTEFVKAVLETIESQGTSAPAHTVTHSNRTIWGASILLLLSFLWIFSATSRGSLPRQLLKFTSKIRHLGGKKR